MFARALRSAVTTVATGFNNPSSSAVERTLTSALKNTDRYNEIFNSPHNNDQGAGYVIASTLPQPPKAPVHNPANPQAEQEARSPIFDSLVI